MALLIELQKATLRTEGEPAQPLSVRHNKHAGSRFEIPYDNLDLAARGVLASFWASSERRATVFKPADSGTTQLSTSIFHFPVEAGELDSRSGYRDGRRTCRPAGPRDCPSVCAVGMAGQLGWECRLEWHNTTVHIHLSVPSRDWIVRFTIGLSGWPSDMPAGRTQRLSVGLCRRHGRAAGLGVPTRVAQHPSPPTSRPERSRPFVSAGPFWPSIIRTRYGPQPEAKAACSLHVEAPGGPTHG